VPFNSGHHNNSTKLHILDLQDIQQTKVKKSKALQTPLDISLERTTPKHIASIQKLSMLQLELNSNWREQRTQQN
jgi:hypothetical protein